MKKLIIVLFVIVLLACVPTEQNSKDEVIMKEGLTVLTETGTMDGQSNIIIGENESFQLMFTICNSGNEASDTVLHDGMYEWIWGDEDYCTLRSEINISNEQFKACQDLSKVVAEAWGYDGYSSSNNPSAVIGAGACHTFETTELNAQDFIILQQPVQFNMVAYGIPVSGADADAIFTSDTIYVTFAEKFINLTSTLDVTA